MLPGQLGQRRVDMVHKDYINNVFGCGRSERSIEECRGIYVPLLGYPFFQFPKSMGGILNFVDLFIFFYIISLNVFSKLQFYSKPNQFKYRLKLKPSSLVKVNMLSSEVPLSPLA